MSLINHFLTGTYTVTRSTGGSYVKGIWRPGPTEDIQVKGSLQPLSPREIKLVEEGERLKQLYKFYTDTPLRPIDTKTLARSDKIKVNGDSFKVLSVETWQGLKVRLPHYKTVLAREPEQ